MAQRGIPVPAGEEFSSYDEAARRIGPYVGKRVVIKPKSTNYGLGICIFDQGGSEKDLLDIVFFISFAKADKVILGVDLLNRHTPGDGFLDENLGRKLIVIKAL